MLDTLIIAAPEPATVLYGVQCATYATLAATPEGQHSHRRICLCHWTAATIYLAFAVLKALHVG